MYDLETNITPFSVKCNEFTPKLKEHMVFRYF